MPGKTIQIGSSSGGSFDCYLALPETDGKVPAVVLASAVHGVDAEIRAIADEFAVLGYIAAATCSGARCRGHCRRAIRAPRSARSHA